MKKILIFVFGILSLSIYAQKDVSISLNNPEPRVGDEVIFELDVNFLIDDIKKQTSDEIEIISKGFYGLSKDLKFNIKFIKAGKQQIGPYKFDFNGETYTTDSVIVNVIEKLPGEEGIYVRFVKQNDKYYLISEQLIENKSDLKRKRKETSYTVGGEMKGSDEIAKINEFHQDGVKFSFRGSSRNTRTIDSGSIMDEGFTYSYRKYEVEFDDDFEGEFVLKKNHFENFPKRTKWENIKLKPL